ncbi:MAG: sulfurtransferase [Gemmatimonadetes bacterium]|nr:sulfurtransferase [Gemmatimonadota bacterium]
MTNAPPGAPTIAPVLPGLLVDPAWLRGRLGDPRVRVVDLRGAEAFAAGHVPGAARVDLSALGSAVGPCSNVLLPESEFAALMSSLGISSGDAVIAYDDQWGLAASRLLWALHRYGHGAVALLDGGWDRWTEEGGARASGIEAERSGSFAPAPRADVYADLACVEARVGDGTAVLLDTRSPAEFARGHIPGAVGWDWFNAVPAGSWGVARDPAELRAEWSALGVEPSSDVVVYCRSGMRAAHTYVVLRHVGFERVRLYDGSWQEWEANMSTGRER